jgi:hypothetical protein
MFLLKEIEEIVEKREAGLRTIGKKHSKKKG